MLRIHNTQSREDLYLEHKHSTLGQRSIKFIGSCLWNSLLDKLKSVISTHFCYALKEMHGSKVYCFVDVFMLFLFIIILFEIIFSY